MVKLAPKNPEKRSEQLQGSVNVPEKTDSQEVKEKSRELAEGLSTVVEAGEGSEAAEALVMGEVGEVSGEGKEGDSGGGGATATAQTQTAVTGEAVLPPPKIEVMQIQIAIRVKKEITVLEKEMKRYRKGSNFNPHELTKVMAKIRHLREILARLAYEGAEVIKGWWLQYVKEKS